MNTNKPERLLLSGSDYFQLLLDRHHRQHGLQGNVGRFSVEVKGRLDACQLEKIINNDPIFCWLHSLRLKKQWPLQLPQWIQMQSSDPIPISIFEISQQENCIPKELFEVDIRPYLDPPFQLNLIYFEQDQTTLLFTWSHILMDAQGAEILVRHLGNAIGDNPIQLFASENTKFSITEQLRQTQKARNFIFFEKRSIFISFLEKLDGKRINYYHSLHFSETETEQIIANSRRAGARFGRSVFLLAACMHSFSDLLKRKGRINTALWVPVPQNNRKKGACGPLVGNHLSFLFYRLFPQHLETMQKTVDIIQQQMIDQMRKGIPASFSIMMDLLLRLPLRLYGVIVKSPTKGALASFFFSDTGKTLENFKIFCGLPVSNAIHYPPNSSHPGFTIIFMSFQRKLQVIIAYTETAMNKEDISCFESSLRKNLFE
ncbi:MAG TPA: hypothetical protein PLP93_09470 [Nitrosomonas sp.]|nr:hypothetical protein [Nitrosomonas sp.]HRB46669.1 hypothetical protein [Nitrosomonas sp.]